MHVHASPATNAATSKVLRISLVVTLVYIVLLVVAGVRAHSLALLSEAGHNLSDFFALLLSWGAVYLQGKSPDARKTFGYNRAGVLAAFINGTSLVLISFYIWYEAFRRLLNPVDVHAQLMIWVAAAGVIMNGGIALLLMRGRRDINLRSAIVHEIGDALSTAAVIAGGVAIAFTGQRWIDPALSIGIGVMILWSSIGIIRESLNILLEGTPSGMELERIESAIRTIPGVNDVHDLHVWSIGSDTHSLSCHVSIADMRASESETLLRQIRDQLGSRFHIHHTTIQFEYAVCEVAHGCVIPSSPGHEHTHDH
ncbi:MAG TPA: cation diffusion facilitator family transporter [Candidatus Limnocylindrales bacterium]|jgi:cobalt-zinc-cadmium efflux system protein|nr:cation diffusion facilitator family transporter [Candidatus Limnocylindrales bacterium]